MSGALTKRNENFNHRFHGFTQIFLFSAFSASLRFVIFIGTRYSHTCHLPLFFVGAIYDHNPLL